MDGTIRYGDIVRVIADIDDIEISSHPLSGSLVSDSVTLSRSSVRLFKAEPRGSQLECFLYQILPIDTSGNQKDLFRNPLMFGSPFVLKLCRYSFYDVFLCANQTELADIEKSAYKLSLTVQHRTEGSAYLPATHFRLQPSVSYRSNGKVFYSDLFLIQSVAFPSLFLHCGDINSNYGSIDVSATELGYFSSIEVNMLARDSTHSSGYFTWSFSFFDSSIQMIMNDEKGKSFNYGSSLRFGSVIRLFFPEKKGYLSGSGKDINNFAVVGSQDSEFDSSFIFQKAPYILSTIEDDIKSSKTLFRVESLKNPFQGGKVKWKDSFRLRHVISGAYLHVLGEDFNGSSSCHSQLRLSKFRESSHSSRTEYSQFLRQTSFRFVPINSYVLQSSDYVPIQNQLCYLEFQSDEESGQMSSLLSCGEKRSTSCKLYPDLTSDASRSLIQNSEVEPSFKKENFQTKYDCEMMCVNDTISKAQSSEPFIGSSVPLGNDSSGENSNFVESKSLPLLKSSLLQPELVSKDDIHLVMSLFEFYTYCRDFEHAFFRIYRSMSTNSVSSTTSVTNNNASISYSIPHDTSYQLLVHLRVVRSFLRGLFNSKFQVDKAYENTTKQSAFLQRRNQMFLKEVGIIRYWFEILRLPQVFGIPNASVEKIGTVSEIFRHIYKTLLAACQENHIVHHYIARNRFDDTKFNYLRHFGGNQPSQTALVFPTTSGFLRLVVDHLPFNYGSIKVLQAVLSFHIDLFGGLIDENFVRHLFSKMLEQRDFICKEMTKSRNNDSDPMESLQGISFQKRKKNMDNIISSNRQFLRLLSSLCKWRNGYCLHNQELLFNVLYRPHRLYFFIDSYFGSSFVDGHPSQEKDNQHVLWISWSGLQDIHFELFDNVQETCLRFFLEDFLREKNILFAINDTPIYNEEFRTWCSTMSCQKPLKYFEDKSIFWVKLEDIVYLAMTYEKSELSASVDDSRSSIMSQTDSMGRRSSYALDDSKNSFQTSTPQTCSTGSVSSSSRKNTIIAQFIAQRARDLIQHYCLCLDFVISLCHNRSNYVIEELRICYSYELCFASMSNMIFPSSIRSRFAKLLHVLYLDVFPFEDLRLPASFLHMTNISNGSSSSSLSFNANLPTFFSQFQSSEDLFLKFPMLSSFSTRCDAKITALQSFISHYFFQDSPLFLRQFFDFKIDSPSSSRLSSMGSFPQDTLNREMSSLGFHYSKFPSVEYFLTLGHIMNSLLVCGFYSNHRLLRDILWIAIGIIRSQTTVQVSLESAGTATLDNSVEVKKLISTSSRKNLTGTRDSSSILGTKNSDALGSDSSSYDPEFWESLKSEEDMEAIDNLARLQLEKISLRHDRVAAQQVESLELKRCIIRENQYWDPVDLKWQSTGKSKDSRLPAAFQSSDLLLKELLSRYFTWKDIQESRNFGLPNISWKWIEDSWSLAPTSSVLDEDESVSLNLQPSIAPSSLKRMWSNVLRTNSDTKYAEVESNENREKNLISKVASDGWYHYASDDDYLTSSDIPRQRFRYWNRNRQRKPCWSFVQDLRERGHSWKGILQAFRNSSSEDGIVSFDRVFVEVDRIESFAVDSLPEKDRSTLKLSKENIGEKIDPLLLSLHKEGSYKFDDLVADFLEETLSTVTKIYDIVLHVRVVRLFQELSVAIDQGESIFVEEITAHGNSTVNSNISAKVSKKIKLAKPEINVVKEFEYERNSAEKKEISSHCKKIFLNIASPASIENLDLLELTNGEILSRLFSLILKDDHSQCNMAINLIGRIFSQIKDFSKRLATMQFFLNCNKISEIQLTLLSLKNEISMIFRHTLNCSDNVLSASKYMNTMIALLTDTNTNSSCLPEFRLLFRLLDAHKIVMRLFLLCVDRIGSVDENSRNLFRRLANLSLEYLLLLIKVPCSEYTKEDLGDFVPDLVARFPRDVGSIRIVFEIARKNRWAVYNTPFLLVLRGCLSRLSAMINSSDSTCRDFSFYFTVVREYIWVNSVSFRSIIENRRTSYSAVLNSSISFVQFLFSDKIREFSKRFLFWNCNELLSSMNSYAPDAVYFPLGVRDFNRSLNDSYGLSEFADANNVDCTFDPIESNEQKIIASFCYYLECIGVSSCCGSIDVHRGMLNKIRIRSELCLHGLLSFLCEHHTIWLRFERLAKSILVMIYCLYFEGPAESWTLSNNMWDESQFWDLIKLLLDYIQEFAVNGDEIHTSTFYLDLLIPFVCVILSHSEEYFAVAPEKRQDLEFLYSLREKTSYILQLLNSKYSSYSSEISGDSMLSVQSFRGLKAFLIQIRFLKESNIFGTVSRKKIDMIESSPPDVNCNSKEDAKRAQFQQFQDCLLRGDFIHDQVRWEKQELLWAIMLHCGLWIPREGVDESELLELSRSFRKFDQRTQCQFLRRKLYKINPLDDSGAISCSFLFSNSRNRIQEKSVTSGVREDDCKVCCSTDGFELLFRIIRFVREEIDQSCSDWPAGELRRISIKSSMVHFPEIDTILLVFDIFSGIFNSMKQYSMSSSKESCISNIWDRISKFWTAVDARETWMNDEDSDVDDDKPITLFGWIWINYFKPSAASNVKDRNSPNAIGAGVGTDKFALSSKDVRDAKQGLVNLVKILIDKNLLLWILETISNASYVTLVIQAVQLFNIILDISEELSEYVKEKMLQIFHERNYSQQGMLSFRELFLSCLHDRIIVSVFIRRLPHNFWTSSLRTYKKSYMMVKSDNQPVSQGDNNNSKTLIESTEDNSHTEREEDDFRMFGIRSFEENAEFIDSKCGISSVFELIRRLCEGHSTVFHEWLSAEDLPFSLLSDIVDFISACLSNVEYLYIFRQKDIDFVCQAFDVLIRAIAGPCFSNQIYLVMKTNIIFKVKEILDFPLEEQFVYASRAEASQDVENRKSLSRYFSVLKLRKKALSLLLQFIEGRNASKDCPIYKELMTMKTIAFSRCLSNIWKRAHEQLTYFPEYDKLSCKKQKELKTYILEEGFMGLHLFQYYSDAQPLLASVIQPLSSVALKSFYSSIKLINTSQDRNEAIRQYWNEYHYAKIYRYYDDRLRSLEINWHPYGMMKIYFQIPEDILLLSDFDKEEIKSRLDFASEDRVISLLNLREKIQFQTHYYSSLNRTLIFSKLVNYQANLDQGILVIAAILTFLLLITLRHDHAGFSFSSPVIEIFIRILTIIQVIFVLFRLVQSVVLRVPLIRHGLIQEYDIDSKSLVAEASGMKNQFVAIFNHFRFPFALIFGLALINCLVLIEYHFVPTVLWIMSLVAGVSSGIVYLRTLIDVPNLSVNFQKSLIKIVLVLQSLMDPPIAYNIFFGIIALLSLNMNWFFFCPLILTIVISMSTTLQNVLKAISLSTQQLIMSSLLGLITILIFSFFGFVFFFSFFQDSFNDLNQCNTLLHCSVNFIRYGLLSGGGIGDFMNNLQGSFISGRNSSVYGSRIVFDFLFFVVINILLLNIIFGTIIDTFSNLRDQTNEKFHQMKNFCFICGLSKESFDSSGAVSFSQHIAKEHNMWNYVYFVIYLTRKAGSKDVAKLTSAERYVWNLVKEEDFSWLPKSSSLSLNKKKKDMEKQAITTNENSPLSLDRADGSFELSIQTSLKKLEGNIEGKNKKIMKEVIDLKEKLELLCQKMDHIPNTN